MQTFKIREELITLVQFLKINDYISSGGECRYFIDNNDIYLNDVVVFEKRKKIYPGDILKINDKIIKVESAT